MYEEIEMLAKRARAASVRLAQTSDDERNGALRAMAQALRESAPAVLKANAVDVAAAREKGTKESLIDRLLLTGARIEDMAGAYEWADLVICRAGALTIAELAAAGVPAILVPYPHAVDDHQTGNAKFLVHAGGAFLLPQAELTPEAVALVRIYARGQLLEMAEKARALAKPDAALAVANVCSEMAR